MMELIEANWLLFAIALAIGVAIAWLAFAGTRRTRVSLDRGDALDEGAAPAARNQALIDAEPAPVPPLTPMGLAGTGTAVSAAVEEQQLRARADTAPAPVDDLTRIKGLGPKIQKTLYALDVTTFAQIAAWTEDDVDRIDARLGSFTGRIRRDGWVEQAGYLARGDIEGFKSRFGAV